MSDQPQQSDSKQKDLDIWFSQSWLMDLSKEEAKQEAISQNQTPLADTEAQFRLEGEIETGPRHQTLRLDTCSCCKTTLAKFSEFCPECGYICSSETEDASTTQPFQTGMRFRNRYTLVRRLDMVDSIDRWEAEDESDGNKPVLIYFASNETEPSTLQLRHDETKPSSSRDTVEDINLDVEPITAEYKSNITNHGFHLLWPGIAWHVELLERHPKRFGKKLDTFQHEGWNALVVARPEGSTLRHFWDAPHVSMRSRFKVLGHLARTLTEFHQSSILIDELSPELVFVTDAEEIQLSLSCRPVPMPIPEKTPILSSFSIAPERISAPENADPRANLFSFGALLYALHLGRNLQESDFDGPGIAQPFITRFPLAHPLFTRLINLTFQRNVEHRLPHKEQAFRDPTGFHSLIEILDHGSDWQSSLKLQLGSFTSTGLIRSLNEDAIFTMQETSFRLDRVSDQSLVILTDGMGGYEAGEEASRIAMKEIRSHLFQQAPFQELLNGGYELYLTSSIPVQDHLIDAQRKANLKIWEYSQLPEVNHAMGCTCELLWFDQDRLILAHVGDSRTYLQRNGELKLLTIDHTTVDRLVRAGLLSPEEAESHPRRHELYQALGTMQIVDPQLASIDMSAGDTILVCSDGLTSHVIHEDIRSVLQLDESPELLCRRLVNMAIDQGGSDNISVVVIRAT